MDRLPKISISLVVLCIVLSASSYSELIDDEGSNSSEDHPRKAFPYGDWVMLVLGCELPGERPMMTAPSVLYPSITNTSAAKTYAMDFFPEFDGVSFENDLYLGCYAALMGDRLLWVYPSGAIIFSMNHPSNVSVRADEFTLSSAASVFESFVNGHGGLASYKMSDHFRVAVIGGDDSPTGEIEGWNLEYRKTYSGYPVYGADRITGSVDAPGSVVSLMYRYDLRLDGPVQTLQVISAKTAWDSIPDGAVQVKREVTIDSIELCYYCPSYREAIPALYPAWRFSSGSFEMYVNAFNGTLYDV